MTCSNTRTGQERLSAEGTTRISIFLDAGKNYVWTAKQSLISLYADTELCLYSICA